MKGTKVASFPHPLDPQKQRARSGAKLAKWHQGNQNARDWRRLLSERYDRNSPERDPKWRIHLNAEQLLGKSESGPGWDHWAATLRPMPHRFLARRAPPFKEYTAIVVPDLLNRYRGQNAGAVYLVLACGEGVTSIQPGNAIVASAHVGSHRGEVIGPQIRELWADVDVQDGESDVIRRAGGDVLAVVNMEGTEMKLEPTLDRIVVKRDKSESHSPGGLVIPDNARKKSQQGEVLAVGPGPWKAGQEAPIRVGETVLFGEYGGIDIRIGTDDLVVLREEEVTGIIRP